MKTRHIGIVGLCLGVAMVGVSPAQTVLDPVTSSISTELTGLRNPMGVDVDAQGRVYVADSGTGRILRGVPGNFSALITGMPVGNYVGVQISALAVHISQDQSLWVGDGALTTASGPGETNVDLVRRFDLNGSLLQTMGSVAGGGNWFGLADGPGNSDLFALSSNGDFIFRAQSSGASYGAFSQWAATQNSNLTSPTAMVFKNNIAYIAGFPGFFGNGIIQTYDANGNVINAAWSENWNQLTGLDIDANGDLIVGEYGTYLNPGQGAVWRVNTTTGARTKIAEGFGFVNDIAVGPDGSIWVTETLANNQLTGKLHRIQVVPEPASMTALALGVAALVRRKTNKCSRRS